jgi:predicted secreted hydrolase
VSATITRRALLLAALPSAASAAVDTGPLMFPRDFGSHNASSIEWWYVTGEVHVDGSDETCGFQITFFRSRTGLARDNASRFAARQLLIAHAALSDLRAGKLVHAQRVGRWSERDDDSLLAYASTRDARVRIGDWLLQRDAASRSYQARFGDRDAGFAFELAFAATQPVLLQGDAGLSRKGPGDGDFSRYYSEPQLAVSGALTRGRTTQAVRGRAWLDHEWSDAPLPREAVGWDWLGINLDDGGALTAFRLRRADGSALWSGGSLRARADAPVRTFANGELRLTPGRRWTSPATRASYPVEWTIESPAGRHTVRARMDAQELDSRAGTGAVYWEGLSELLAQGRVVGRGYLEMTGYAGRLAL